MAGRRVPAERVARLVELLDAGLTPGRAAGAAGVSLDFVDGLLHDLRRRGIVSDGYQGTTLRENLGLPLEDLVPARL